MHLGEFLNLVFLAIAVLMFAHALSNRWYWRKPQKLFRWGVTAEAHKDLMRLLEFEALAALLGIGSALFDYGWLVNIIELLIATSISVMFALIFFFRVWRRPTLNRAKVINLLMTPIGLGVIVSAPAWIRIGRQFLAQAF